MCPCVGTNPGIPRSATNFGMSARSICPFMTDMGGDHLIVGLARYLPRRAG